MLFSLSEESASILGWKLALLLGWTPGLPSLGLVHLNVLLLEGLQFPLLLFRVTFLEREIKDSQHLNTRENFFPWRRAEHQSSSLGRTWGFPHWGHSKLTCKCPCVTCLGSDPALEGCWTG